jgi:hypothetical protein
MTSRHNPRAVEPKKSCTECGEDFVPETAGDEMCSWSCVSQNAFNQMMEEDVAR